MKQSIPGLLRAASNRGFPFLLGGSKQVAIVRLRRAAIRQRLSRYSLTLRWLIQIAMIIAWPIGAARSSVAALRGPPGRAIGSSPLQRLRLAIAAYASALLHNSPPSSYFTFRLYEPDRGRNASLFLFASDAPGLLALNSRRGASNDDVQDKLSFARLCREHSIPCIETLAAFRGGKQILPATPFTPDQPALWIKPIRGSHGDGASRWRWIGGRYVDQEGHAYSVEQLLQYCRQRDCLVQPVLENHPSLSELSDGRLIDVRIVTGIDRGGAVHVIFDPLVRMPYTALPWQRVPILGLVNTRSGCVMQATLEMQAIDHHPDSGVPLIGRVMPDWAEAIALVQRAHSQAFARFVFLGWDVAFTPQGARLVETNSGWSAELVQWLTGQPLGATHFGEILRQYL